MQHDDIFNPDFVRAYREYQLLCLVFCASTLSAVELRNLNGERNWKVF